VLSDSVLFDKYLDMVRLSPQKIASVSPQKVRCLIFDEVGRGLIGLNDADGSQLILNSMVGDFAGKPCAE